VAINCAALPDQLLESELFGHERGAFTGAVTTKPGRIEQAANGVLFLDEVGEMAPTVQAKLLRVLEEREFMRLGSTRVIHADIQASLPRPTSAIFTRRCSVVSSVKIFTIDSVFEISPPPLRERPDLCRNWPTRFSPRSARTSAAAPAAGISREARDHLLAYSWPWARARASQCHRARRDPATAALSAASTCR
jgi:transcriptional regulator with PAS, ATPase and Fis domain